MNDQQREKIANLAAAAHEKRERFRMLGMMNVNGLDPQARMQASMDYAVAEADMHNAQGTLDRAIHEVSNGTV